MYHQYLWNHFYRELDSFRLRSIFDALCSSVDKTKACALYTATLWLALRWTCYIYIFLVFIFSAVFLSPWTTPSFYSLAVGPFFHSISHHKFIPCVYSHCLSRGSDDILNTFLFENEIQNKNQHSKSSDFQLCLDKTANKLWAKNYVKTVNQTTEVIEKWKSQCRPRMWKANQKIIDNEAGGSKKKFQMGKKETATSSGTLSMYRNFNEFDFEPNDDVVVCTMLP